jgi:Flp pilus assembly protein TadG
MRLRHRLLRDDRGAAAAEMALIFPLLLIIGMGAVELGNYFLDEHRLVKAVRDGARYAARQDFSNYAGCTTTAADVSNAQGLIDNTHAIVQTGLLSGGSDLLPKWSSATFKVQMTCNSTVGSQTLSGIYTNTTGAAPPAVVVVTATVPYVPVAVSGFGFKAAGYNLYAQEQAAVTGV